MEGVTDLPPGFQFHPTEEELILYYLRNKSVPSKTSASLSLTKLIREVDVFGFDPVDLPAKAGIAAGVGEWFFFTERIRGGGNGGKWRRETESGAWETVGADLPIVSKKEGVVGTKKTLAFYRRNPPYYTETYWMMDEYVLDHGDLGFLANEDSCAICRVFLDPNGRRRRLSNAGHPYLKNNHVGASQFHFDGILDRADETTISCTGEIDVEQELASENDELQRILTEMLDAEDDLDILQSSNPSLHQEMLPFDSRAQENGHLYHASELPPAILEGDFIELNDLIFPDK